MSWDDDDFETKLPPGVAEPPASWDDEEDKTLTEEAPEPTATGPAAPVVFKAKHAAKEKKKAEEAAAAAARDDDEGPSDPVARKRWIEEKQKAADLLLAVDSFGLGDGAAVAAPVRAAAASSPPKPATAAAAKAAAPAAAAASGVAAAPPGSLAAAAAGLVLTDAASFGVAGTRIGQCVADAPASKPAGAPHALAFVRELVTATADRLSPDDLQSLRTLLDGFRNKKLQAAKTGVKKPLVAPKKGQKGGRLMMEADDDYLSHAHGAAVGADDYADMGDSGPVAGAAAPKAWGAVDDFM